MTLLHYALIFFFFNDTATTEIYTLSLHDALPICFKSLWLCYKLIKGYFFNTISLPLPFMRQCYRFQQSLLHPPANSGDRKSTRLNSSHTVISYAVFCLKKKKQCSLVFNSTKLDVL